MLEESQSTSIATLMQHQIIEDLADRLSNKLIEKQKQNFVEPSRSELPKEIVDWLAAGATGVLNGKHWSKTYIEQMSLYSKTYLRKLPANIDTPLTIESLRTVLAKEPGFSNKRWYYDMYRSLTLYLTINSRIPASRREEVKQFKPRRQGLPSKKFIHRHEKTLLIKGVWLS